MSSENQLVDKTEPVDIDQLEVSIAIIAKSPQNLAGAAQFLTRRGWPTTCLGDMSKAIGTICNDAPDIVLISVDHPNPNVIRLPVLLSQSLNAICIGFTEKGGALSIDKLNKSRFQHKFNGFPSGPSLHRFLRQTLDRIYNPEAQGAERSSASLDGNQDQHIQVKGEKASDLVKIQGSSQETNFTNSESSHQNRTAGPKKKLKDLIVQKAPDAKGPKLSAAELLNKLNSDSSGANTNNQSGDDPPADAAGSDGYYQEVLAQAGSLSEKERNEKKSRVEKKKKQFAWQKAKSDIDTPISDQKKRPGAEFSLKQNRKSLTSKELEAESQAKAQNPDQLEIQKDIKGKNGLIIPEAKPKSKALFELGEGTKNGKTELAESEGSDPSRGIKSENEELSGLAKKVKVPVAREVVPSKRKLNEEEDIFKQTVSKALKNNCEEANPEVLIKIEETQQLGVIPVDSAKIHGYFLVGRGGIGFSLGTVFLEFLAESIEKELSAQGIDVQCQKPFLVDTQSFDFDLWASTVENFTIFEQTGREEIALTFVPTKERLPEMLTSEISQDMAKIELDRISTQVPVTFNSYIHMKRNNKFFLYLKTGNKILQRQKETLKKRKQTKLHINKEDFDKFKKYLAEELIQNLVKEVRKQAKKKKDAA